MSDKIKKIKTVDIVEFSKKGNGIGYFERQDATVWPLEVPFTMPGDRVNALLLKKRRGNYQSKLEEIINESPDRTTPQCKHFGSCGGCRWQHIPYHKQLIQKEEKIETLFKPWLNDTVKLHPILPSQNQWHYRNKMEYSFSSDSTGSRYLGLMMDQSRGRVFHLTECHLPNPWFVDAVHAVREWWKETGLDAFHPYRNTGHLRNLTLREGMNTGDRMVNLTVSGNPDFAMKKHQLESFSACVRQAIEPIDPECKLSIFVTIQQAQKGLPTRFFEMHLYGQDHIREKIGELEFMVSPSAFFQPNTLQAEILYKTALGMADLKKTDSVYDLYCGTGTLGIYAARLVKQVVGIELSRESSNDARQNVKINQLDNVVILTGSVDEKLKEIQEQQLYPKPDLVLLDPPRSGLDSKALELLIALNAPKLIYISCNPETQAQNIGELIKAGYRLIELQPVDQFPHTIHIENIALLTK